MTSRSGLTLYERPVAAGFRVRDDVRLADSLTGPRTDAGLPAADHEHDWLVEAFREISALEGLAPGWDGYEALPVSRLHANRAYQFLRAVMTDDTPLPDFVPLSDGGIQLEWHLAQVRVDFITDSEGTPTVLVEHADGALDEVPAATVRLDDFKRTLVAGMASGSLVRR
jgi:hypothetical protein